MFDRIAHRYDLMNRLMTFGIDRAWRRAAIAALKISPRDCLIDLACGWNAGVKRSILVRTGYGARVEAQKTPELAREIVVDDIPAMADFILKDSGAK